MRSKRSSTVSRRGRSTSDELSTEVKRAVELLAVCRDKLERTENEVGELVADLRADDAGNKPAAVADDAEAEASDEGLPF